MHNSIYKTSILLLAILVTSASLSRESIAQESGSLQEALQTVARVGLNGDGQTDAVAAMRVINEAVPSDLRLIVDAMENAKQPALNWLRAAAVTVNAKRGKFPRSDLVSRFEDRDRSAYGRLMAYELVASQDEAWALEQKKSLAGDPSMPLREIGINYMLEQAADAEGDAKTEIAREAFPLARDLAQVITLHDMLTEAGDEIDLASHLGFIRQWNIVGCFDNKDEKGFDVVHGPESNLDAIDTSAGFENHLGETSQWQVTATEDRLGVIDVADPDVLGPVKGVGCYALAGYQSSAEREVEFRIGTPNAHKIWLNGELIMSNEIYHNSNSPDKFTATAKLKPGDNRILVKLCQNEQTQQWAQDWQFQLRICDENGKGITD